jgi:hypothetical protein
MKVQEYRNARKSATARKGATLPHRPDKGSFSSTDIISSCPGSNLSICGNILHKRLFIKIKPTTMKKLVQPFQVITIRASEDSGFPSNKLVEKWGNTVGSQLIVRYLKSVSNWD